MDKKRREILKRAGLGSLAIGTLGSGFLYSCTQNKPAEEAEVTEAEQTGASAEPWFSISLAQWSLHNMIFGEINMGWEEFGRALREDASSVLNGTLDPIDFPAYAKNEFGIDAVEFVNTFYMDKARDTAYLTDLRNRCTDNGVKPLIIMCDAEGQLGNLNEQERIQAVENHHKWVDAAKFLGCHSIRVNAAGNGTADEVWQAAVDGLGRLSEYGASNDIHVIVENHGGYSSDGQWLSGVIKEVNSPYCGTLPDFGNFCIERTADGCANEYDRYKGVKELMPFAQGVSAKSHDFNEQGNEVHTDFERMMGIVRESGFRGHVGIEYEGSELSEVEGIKATKALLERFQS